MTSKQFKSVMKRLEQMRYNALHRQTSSMKDGNDVSHSYWKGQEIALNQTLSILSDAEKISLNYEVLSNATTISKQETSQPQVSKIG